MRSRFYIGTWGVLMLVALRLTIGWHFFKEGLGHYSDPNFSTDGFFRQAKGPLGPYFHALVPDYEFHGWDLYILSPREDTSRKATATSAKVAADAKAADAADSDDADVAKDANKPAAAKPPKPYEEWLTQVKTDWKQSVDRLAARFGDIKDEANAALTRREGQLEDLLSDNEDDIRTYRHELWRLAQMRTAPGAKEVPNQEARIANRASNPTAERGVTMLIDSQPAAWQSGAREIDQAFKDDLARLTAGKDPTLSSPDDSAWWITGMQKGAFYFGKYGVLAIGVLLIVGLFTRVASWAGALFLLSILATQPPWLPESIPTFFYYQLAEMVALLVLAGTAAGRWCGLDFFTYRLFGWYDD